MPDASPPADNDQPKQPFIPPADRPAVEVNPDTPLSELRVRDLAAILGPQLAHRRAAPVGIGFVPERNVALGQFGGGGHRS